MRSLVIFLLICCFAGHADAQFRKRNNTSNSSTESNLNYSNPTEYTIADIDVSGLKV